MGKTLGEIEAIPASEVVEWMAFERLEGPIGRGRSDVPLAMLAHFLAGGLGGVHGSLEDYLPYRDRSMPPEVVGGAGDGGERALVAGALAGFGARVTDGEMGVRLDDELWTE